MRLDVYPVVASWEYGEYDDDVNVISLAPDLVRDWVAAPWSDASRSATVEDLSDAPPEATPWHYLVLQHRTRTDPDERSLPAHPHVELDDQSGGGCYDISGVHLYPQHLEIDFGPRHFLDEYATVAVHFTRTGVPRGVVQFFADGLYLADRMTYSDDFPDVDRAQH